MHKITGSKAELARWCLYPFKDTVEWPADNGTRHVNARIGSALAKAQAIVINRTSPLDLKAIAASFALRDENESTFLALFAAWRRDVNPLLGWRAEVALAYAPASDTARELGVDTGRDYSDLKETEIPLTSDVVTLGEDGAGAYVEVRDVKSGRQVETIGAPEELGQLRLGAVAASRLFGVDRARVVLDLVTPDGVESREGWLDALELDGIASETAGWLETTPSAEPTPGPWCSELYCPVRSSCPRGSEALAQVVPAEALTRFRLSPTIESPAHLEWTRGMVSLARAALDAVEEGTHAYADAHDGVPLSDGTIFRFWEETRRQLDITVPGAVEAMQEAGIGDLVKPTAALGAIEKRLGRDGAANLLARLRLLGAVKSSKGGKYEAKKGKAA